MSRSEISNEQAPPSGRKTQAVSTPQQWGNTFSGPPVLSSEKSGWTPALLRLWSETSPNMEQPELSHHYIVLHLGGAKRIRRHREGPTVHKEVESGALTIVPAGTAYSWLTEGPIGFAHLYLPPRLVDQVVLEEFDRDPRTVSLIDRVGWDDPLLEPLFRGMLREIQAPGIAPRLFLDSMLRAFTFKLLRDHSSLQTEATSTRHELAPYRLRQVLDFIEARMADDIALHDLADLSGASVYHFSRGFRCATGVPPYRFLVERRIERAKALLHETLLPLSDIAKECGFNSQRQFGTMFTKLAGVSPGRFRRER